MKLISFLIKNEKRPALADFFKMDGFLFDERFNIWIFLTIKNRNKFLSICFITYFYQFLQRDKICFNLSSPRISFSGDTMSLFISTLLGGADTIAINESTTRFESNV